jgi:hypothetical protein
MESTKILGPSTQGDEMQTEEKMDRMMYMALHTECAVCWWPADRRGRWLELHHIVGGAGRKDLPENWIALCNRCHHAVHNKLPEFGELPRGSVLEAKEEVDGYVDVAVLASLKRRAALPYEQCPIPTVFLDERARNGGEAWP